VLIIVPRSPHANSSAGNRFVWPHASLGKEHLLLGTNVMTEQGDIAYTYVPLDFAAHDGRQMHTTLSHEVGHNLGLLDVYDIEEYSADVTARITSDWEMMAGSRDRLPHYSISNKMRMGWCPQTSFACTTSRARAASTTPSRSIRRTGRPARGPFPRHRDPPGRRPQLLRRVPQRASRPRHATTSSPTAASS
jgi:M6 family metalloprotease-like protein